MNDLLEKAKGYFNELTKVTTIKLGVIHGVIKGIVVGFLATVVILVATFYFAWLLLFSQGKAMLGDLLSLIDRVISPQMVAFVTFITTCFVDKDKDGVPDKFENERSERK